MFLSRDQVDVVEVDQLITLPLESIIDPLFVKVRYHRDVTPLIVHVSDCGARYKSRPGLTYNKLHNHAGENGDSSVPKSPSMTSL